MSYPPIGVVRMAQNEGGMMLEVAVPDPQSTYDYFGAASVIQFQSATSYGGSYSDLTTVALVETETFYRYEHAAGTSTTWYRYRYEASNGTDVSAWSPSFSMSPVSYTLQTLRQELAKEMGMYTSGTTTAAGSTSTVVDSAQIVSISNTNQWKGGWLKMTSGSANGQVRVISDYAIATGTFTVTPVLSAGSGSGSTYEVYRDMSPVDLDDAINDALMLIHVEDSYLFAGDKTTNFTGRREYPMPITLTRSAQIIGLEWCSSWGDVTGERLMSVWHPIGTSEWEAIERRGIVSERSGSLSIRLNVVRGPNTIYRVLYMRPAIYAHDLRLSSDTDTLALPMQDVIIAAKYQAYDLLVNKAPPNARAGEWDKRRDAAKKSWHKMIGRYNGQRGTPLYEQNEQVSVRW